MVPKSRQGSKALRVGALAILTVTGSQSCHRTRDYAGKAEGTASASQAGAAGQAAEQPETGASGESGSGGAEAGQADYGQETPDVHAGGVGASGGSTGQDAASGGAAGELGGAENVGGTRARALGALEDDENELAPRRVPPPEISTRTSVDLSDRLPPVGDQGSEQSAVAWAAASIKSYQMAVQEGWEIRTRRHQFSPAWIYNQVASGMDKGAKPSDVLNLLVDSGADSLLFFPYRAGSFRDLPDPSSLRRAARFRSSDWEATAANTNGLKRWLAAEKPLLVTFEVHPDFDALDDLNAIYDDVTGPSRGRHAAVLCGYSDERAAFRVLNSWGAAWGQSGMGWLAYSVVESPDLRLTAYVLDEGPIAPPPTNGNLYVIESKHLWRADSEFGDYAIVSQEDWSSASAIAAWGGSLFIAQKGRLQRANPGTGAFTYVGGDLPSDDAFLSVLGPELYIIAGEGLFKITDPASGDLIPIAPTGFSGVTCMTTAGGSIVVIQDGQLATVDPHTGAMHPSGDPIWYDHARITAIDDRVYILHAEGIWVVDDLATGSFRRLGSEDWSQSDDMTTLGGKLYVIRNSELRVVDLQDGSSEALGGADWADSPIMAGLP